MEPGALEEAERLSQTPDPDTDSVPLAYLLAASTACSMAPYPNLDEVHSGGSASERHT